MTKKKESKFQTEFNTWLRHYWSTPAVFELKIVQAGRSLSCSQLQDHQISSLKKAKHTGLIYKIPDVGRLRKPFDSFYLRNIDAYLVIQFHKRGVKHFYMVDIDTLLEESRKLDETVISEIGHRFELA